VIAAAQAFFMPAADPGDLAAPGDQRFCVFHAAAGDELRGCVVYIHPFAEEMNKTRRMAALQSRALAAAGFSVLQIDLQGCGESSGDFGDASWQGWIEDVLRAVAWLRSRDAAHSAAPLWLWGMRSGCLLAAQAAAKLDAPCNFCFWQPSINGQTLLQQFLRLRLAAGLFGGAGSEVMGEMRASLEQGRSVEVAGYTLSSALAQGLEQARLSPPTRAEAAVRVEWFELSTRLDAQVSPVSLQALAQWTDAGLRARHRIVQGPSFWQTVEIEEAPALIEQTLAAFQDSETHA
jgi:exosortase A-associated hydrolase 2